MSNAVILIISAQHPDTSRTLNAAPVIGEGLTAARMAHVMLTQMGYINIRIREVREDELTLVGEPKAEED